MKLSIYGSTLHLTPETEQDKLILHTLVETKFRGFGRHAETGDVLHVELHRSFGSEITWLKRKLIGMPISEAQSLMGEMGMRLHRIGTITTCEVDRRRLHIKVDESGRVSDVVHWG